MLDSLGVDLDHVLALVPDDRKAETRELLEGDYADIVTTNHQVVWVDGVLRWKVDPLLRALIDAKMFDLNGLMMAVHEGRISPDLYLDLNRRIGYSLSGFCEIVDSHPDLFK